MWKKCGVGLSLEALMSLIGLITLSLLSNQAELRNIILMANQKGANCVQKQDTDYTD